MQNFLVVEIVTQADGRIAAPVNAFETEAEARSKFHAVMTQAYKSSNPIHSCSLLTGEGFELCHECVKHEQSQE